MRGEGAELEVLVVHRPAYGDWVFPKGKAEPGESDEACALREVREEAGLVCEVLGPAGETCYVDGNGREKRVRYFLMRARAGAFAPHAEIDDARWLPLAAARDLLSHESDRELLPAAAWAGGAAGG